MSLRSDGESCQNKAVFPFEKAGSPPPEYATKYLPELILGVRTAPSRSPGHVPVRANEHRTIVVNAVRALPLAGGTREPLAADLMRDEGDSHPRSQPRGGRAPLATATARQQHQIAAEQV